MIISHAIKFRKLAGELAKQIDKIEDAKHPVVFLGGNCKDNSWREDLKKEFEGKLVLLDPYDAKWKADENIYEELAAIVNADHVIFYKGAEGTGKEKQFLDRIRPETDYEEFDNLKSLKDYLKQLAQKVGVKKEAKEGVGTVSLKVIQSYIKLYDPNLTKQS